VVPHLGQQQHGPPVTATGIISVEQLRGALAGLPGVTLAVSLTRPGEDTDADRQTAKAFFGLEVRAEPDGEPHCDWCGRSSPPSGLADESLGGPEVHACVDGDDCAASRAEREGKWIDRTWKTWAIDLQKYRAAQEYERELEARKWQTGDIYRDVGYQLTAPVWEPDEELTALDYAALESVRLAVEHCMEGHAAQAELRLTAPEPPAPIMLPGCGGPDGCTHHTLMCPRKRGHLYQGGDPGLELARVALARSG
jgi:hypothetical protein